MRRRFRRDPNAPPKPARGVVTTHCQICERDIKALGSPGGEQIAHHGYRRPGTGWQSASCEGARQLPWEISCETLVAHVAVVQNRRERMHELATGPITSLHLQVGYEPNHREVPRTVEVSEGTLAAIALAHPAFERHNRIRNAITYTGRAPTWSELVERYRAERAAEVKALDSYLAHQRNRLANWKPAP